MAKKESTFVNMVLTLFLVCGIAAGALGYIYTITKEPIETAKKDFLYKQINVVVPGADQGEIGEPIEKEGLKFYVVKDNSGQVIGTAVESFTESGFSGRFDIIVGFDQDGKILDSNVLTHKETPGLGDKMSKDVAPWNEQFKEKDPASYKLIVKKDGGDVDAITAATISSRGYCDALQKAYDGYMKFKNEGGIK
ncbi:MAG: RnfABCDGE type electron transport complex subunit G [Bacteroidales bacterium]|nr:RnfABCDGE type electron transport complex subunit G [Bacteroidales bacterium]